MPPKSGRGPHCGHRTPLMSTPRIRPTISVLGRAFSSASSPDRGASGVLRNWETPFPRYDRAVIVRRRNVQALPRCFE